ncbi:MAG TPA: hypothetical protein VH682_23375 [Gemmataceae bacterium]|jgi:WD40 repeat protein
MLRFFMALFFLYFAGMATVVRGEAAKSVCTDALGDPLPPEARARLGTTRFWQRGIPGFAFSPDGKTLVSSGEDDVYVWDLLTGREVRRFPKRTNTAVMAYSADGKILAIRSGGVYPIIAWWEMPSGRLMHEVRHDRSGDALLFSRDGKMLVSAGFDKIIRIWDVVSGEERRQLRGCEEGTRSLVFSPDGKQLIGPGEKGTIRVWDVASGKQVRQWSAHREGVHSVALDRAGKTLASAGRDNTVILWDIATGAKRRLLRGHVGMVNSIAFSPDGKLLASLGENTTSIQHSNGERETISHDNRVIYLWDVTTGRQVHALHRCPDYARQIAFSPDGKLLAVADAKISFYDVSTGRRIRELPGHDESVYSLAVSPDGRMLASGSSDKTIRVWDLRAGKEIRRHSLHHRSAASVVLSPDGRTLIWPDEKRLCFADFTTRDSLPSLDTRERVRDPVLSPDGKMLAAMGDDNIISLWQLPERRLLRQFKEPGGALTALTFSPNGKTLAASDVACVAYLLDTATGKKLLRLHEGDTGWRTAVAFSPDGGMLLTGSSHQGARLWDGKTGKEVATLGGPRSAVPAVVFSPDGRMMATAEWDDHPSVFLWEVATRKERHRFEGHLDSVNCLAFAADGKTLFSGSGDTTILVWDVLGIEKTQETVNLPPTREALWKDLESDDAGRAFRAIRELVHKGGQTVSFLQKRLRPVPQGEARRIAQRIADLDSDQFAVRDQAMRDLERMGESAGAALQEALQGQPSLEIRRRIEQLLEKLREDERSPERLRMSRALEVLEHIGTREARQLLEALAGGAPGAWLTREAKASAQRLERRSAPLP